MNEKPPRIPWKRTKAQNKINKAAPLKFNARRMKRKFGVRVLRLFIESLLLEDE